LSYPHYLSPCVIVAVSFFLQGALYNHGQSGLARPPYEWHASYVAVPSLLERGCARARPCSVACLIAWAGRRVSTVQAGIGEWSAGRASREAFPICAIITWAGSFLSHLPHQSISAMLPPPGIRGFSPPGTAGGRGAASLFTWRARTGGAVSLFLPHSCRPAASASAASQRRTHPRHATLCFITLCLPTPITVCCSANGQDYRLPAPIN
jgi:hypothetical protein